MCVVPRQLAPAALYEESIAKPSQAFLVKKRRLAYFAKEKNTEAPRCSKGLSIDYYDNTLQGRNHMVWQAWQLPYLNFQIYQTYFNQGGADYAKSLSLPHLKKFVITPLHSSSNIKAVCANFQQYVAKICEFENFCHLFSRQNFTIFVTFCTPLLPILQFSIVLNKFSKLDKNIDIVLICIRWSIFGSKLCTNFFITHCLYKQTSYE